MSGSPSKAAEAVEEADEVYYEFFATEEDEDEADGGSSTPVRFRTNLSLGRLDNIPVGGVSVSRSDSGRRPSSVHINDNDDLLNLADQLQRRDFEEEARARTPPTPQEKHHNFEPRSASLPYHQLQRKHGVFVAEGGKRKAPVHLTPTAQSHPPSSSSSSLVRRNSSGYSSGGGDAKNGIRIGNIDTAPEARRSSLLVTGRNNRSHISLSPSRSFIENDRRASACEATKGSGRKSISTGLGHLFGAGSASRKSSTGEKKLSRKYDRPKLSAEEKIRNKKKVKDYGVDKTSDGGESKAHLFVSQGRSSTGLNLFARRKSVAVTDDLDPAKMLRPAKSNVDLLSTETGVMPSPTMTKKKSAGSIAGPGLTDLQEEKAAAERKTSTSKDSPKSVVSFVKGRSWTEIERLWRGKAKEPPNIEPMFKPRSSFRSKGAAMRFKTIPLGSDEGPPPEVTTPSTPPLTRPQSSSSMMCSVYPTPPSPVASPAASRKAVDLLAPHVLHRWHCERGHHHHDRPNVASTNSYQRFSSMPEEAPPFGDRHLLGPW